MGRRGSAGGGSLTQTINDYIAAVRALIDELNRESASGLITARALPLISTVDRMTRTLERLREQAAK